MDNENCFQGTKTLKQRREEERKVAEASGDTRAWNSLFMRPDTIVENVARKYGVSKSDLLDREADDLAVRIALGETQNLPYGATENELAKILGKFGSLDKIILASTKTLALVFFLSPSFHDMSMYFLYFGEALNYLEMVFQVVFLEPTEAKADFTGLAYKRYKKVIEVWRNYRLGLRCSI
ncbi:putative nucleotide-binding alpha-beta plait domain-containing protein [Medicago truncatula]|uniref:Putative nucleotide-binding alpha-beta plait domain-containing protein n=1 Tax=Medicago truncatula TaxID=3880 RepID=A0A396J6M8_MEDTR|nr:putative nucleotide-binding alpha-beta plait domain-containing protein [Medicago truncatula]